jgi:hypothetical protein
LPPHSTKLALLIGNSVTAQVNDPPVVGNEDSAGENVNFHQGNGVPQCGNDNSERGNAVRKWEIIVGKCEDVICKLENVVRKCGNTVRKHGNAIGMGENMENKGVNSEPVPMNVKNQGTRGRNSDIRLVRCESECGFTTMHGEGTIIWMSRTDPSRSHEPFVDLPNREDLQIWIITCWPLAVPT